MVVMHSWGKRFLFGGVTGGLLFHLSTASAVAEEAEASLPHLTVVNAQLTDYIRHIQDPTTGLPPSFTESLDRELNGVTFTYDAAVAALALTHAGELSDAHRALVTYLRMPLPRAETFDFNTAYQASTGRPTLEYRVHAGPIFWVAIALMRYAQASGDQQSLEKGISLLEWARTHLPHSDGGVAMSHKDGQWSSIMSVENNWVYYAALRIATRALPDGEERQALLDEQRGVRAWLAKQGTNRGADDPVKALDVYTHPLLVGPSAHLEDGAFDDPAALSAWAKAAIAEMSRLFQVPGSALYDYTDEPEARNVGRARTGWLEGTEQVSVAYETWAPWFEQQGDVEFAKELRMKAALSHAEVLGYALHPLAGLAIPNTSAVLPVRTFSDGWFARPRSEPALNGTNWTSLAEAHYNPFTTEPPRRTR